MPAVIDALTLTVREECYSTMTFDELRDHLDSPDWGDRSRVHNWKNYVSERMKQIWAECSIEVRLALFLGATKQAQAEEWD